MKTNDKSVQEIRADAGRKARYVRTAGAFGKRRPGQNIRGDTSTRDALARILGNGESAMCAALNGNKITLPSNWGGSSLVHSVDGGQPWHGWRTCRPEVFEKAARLGGWMKAIGELINEHPKFFSRAATKLARKPDRGCGSPHNDVGGILGFFEGRSLERWKTPGKAFRRISHGIRRAKEILAGFNITSVPWTVVMNELGAPKGPQRGHKIGQHLALKTLIHFTGICVPVPNRASSFALFKGFRHDAWRKMTSEVRGYYKQEMEIGVSFNKIIIPPVREDDGVKMFVLTENEVCRHTVVEGYAVETYTRRRSGAVVFSGLRKQTLIVSGTGRTYHLGWWPSDIRSADKMDGMVYLNGSYSSRYPILPEWEGRELSLHPRFWGRFAVRLARQAWILQDAALKAEGLQVPSDCSVLVFWNDSYRAGNCELGTRAFAEARGWEHRHFVPVEWLLCSQEHRAQAAAKVALQRYWASVK